MLNITLFLKYFWKLCTPFQSWIKSYYYYEKNYIIIIIIIIIIIVVVIVIIIYAKVLDLRIGVIQGASDWKYTAARKGRQD